MDITQLQSTRLLFSCLEFLKDGNLSLLDSEDRQDWIKTVVRLVDMEQNTSNCNLEDEEYDKWLEDQKENADPTPNHAMFSHGVQVTK